jgi:predicted RNA-binding Zn-ribbon protein involved in translation (DUF1610 family)
MDDCAAFLSKDGCRTKLEYTANGLEVVKLWEKSGELTVETTFDRDGAVLQQQLLDGNTDVEKKVKQELQSASVQAVREKPYEEVRLKKPCPNCGSDSLARCPRSVSGDPLPVVPVYRCKSCNKKSYHLNTAYLDYLVRSNTGLFEKGELQELESNRDAFITELEGYILRIFASKRITRIR